MTTSAPMCPIDRARLLIENHLSIGDENYSHWPNIRLSTSGAARVGSILGYGLALCESGVEQLVKFGEKFLADFFYSMDGLNDCDSAREHFDQTPQLLRTHGYDPFAPSRRVMIGDDGTRHGLSFAVYYLVPQDIYDSEFDAHYRRHLASRLLSTPKSDRPALRRNMKHEARGDWLNSARAEYHKERRINGDLTPKYQCSRYRYAYNGGLLYHGPASNAAAITLSSSRLFSTHT